MSRPFAHLHVHGPEGSQLDGLSPSAVLAAEAARDGQPALAITDHDGVGGWLDHRKACAKAGIQPIYGQEFNVVGDRWKRDRLGAEGDAKAYNHHVALAYSDVGVRNVMRLSSLGYLEGFYGKARVDWELLARYSDGLVASTSCLGGEVPQALLRGDETAARACLGRLVEVYGTPNVYVELQRHGIPDQDRINPALIRLAREFAVPLVATNDVHYCGEHDARVHDLMLCLATKARPEDPRRFKFESDQHWLKTAGQMARAFEGLCPEAVDGAWAIAERCMGVDLGITPGVFHLPTFPVPPGFTGDADYLRHLVRQGAERRYGSLDLRPDVVERIDYELSVIEAAGYSSYFLILWDVIEMCAREGIATGPGRGSACGSIVAYALRITGVDPLRWGLLFERFLNPDRVSPPDIDVDYDTRRREDVFEYLRERWGADCVVQIGTRIRIKSRTAVRDAARTLGKPLALGDKLAGLMPPLKFGKDTPLRECLEPINPENMDSYAASGPLRDLVARDADAREVIDLALALEGLTKAKGIHAAAAVITPVPAIDFLPLATVLDRDSGERKVVTQEEMGPVEDRGALKMDVLGLTSLDVVHDAAKAAGVDMEQVPLDDRKVWDLFARGDTAGVFQLSAGHAQNLLRQIRPGDLLELAAVSALDRPGPMGTGMHLAYARRKHRKEARTPPHPSLKDVLSGTHGLMIYQEQLSRVAQVFAGYTPGEADLLRKATGKKVPEILKAERSRWVERSVANGRTEADANALFDVIEPFASYSFNLSHALAYSLVSYWTAWLKVHHAPEFFAALIDSAAAKIEKAAGYVTEARAMGLTVVPPCVNRSAAATASVGGQIVLGLALVRGLGVDFAERVVSARGEGYRGADDFYARVRPNKTQAEWLIQAGALDFTGRPRAGLWATLSGDLTGSKRRTAGVTALLDFDDEPATIDDTPEWPARDRIERERQALGLYVTGHPLADVADRVRAMSSHMPSELDEVPDGTRVQVAGIAASVVYGTTKRGSAKLTLDVEGLDGTVSVIATGKVVQMLQVSNGDAVVVDGRLKSEDGEGAAVKLMAAIIDPLPERPMEPIEMDLPDGMDRKSMWELRRIIEQHPGHHPVVLRVEGRTVRLPDEMRAAPTVVDKVAWVLGDGKARVGELTHV